MTDSANASGLFISLEGIDGCGKSTQIEQLKNWLENSGHSVLTIREPGGSALSEKIRSLLLDPATGEISPTAELLLFNSARAQLVHEIIHPALKNGKIVLADRFGWATYAYQGYGRGLDLNTIDQLRLISCGAIWPQFSFLLDIDLYVMKQRLKTLGKPDRMEQAGDAFFQRVREGYLKIARNNKEQFAVLDGKDSPQSIHRKICDKVSDIIGEKSR